MSWRFLPFASLSAVENMAVDEAILNTHLAGKAPATFRLYEFSPPAVSFGYAQAISPEHLAKLDSLGLDVVRRPTGGRAVLHMKDLTYSLVAPVRSTAFSGDPAALPQSIMQAHKQICQALILTFAHFGIELELGRSQSSYRHLNDCFQATTAADLHYGGRKIVGSAQLRRKSALLQHGSIVLQKSPMTYADLLSDQSQQGAGQKGHEPANGPASLYAILGRSVTPDEFARAFKSGFSQAFSVSFDDGELSELELQEVRRLKSDYLIKSAHLS
jgi:lipoate-protein ligase A